MKHLLLLFFATAVSALHAQSPIFNTQYIETGETSDAVTHITTLDGGMIVASVQHPGMTATYFITVIKTDAAGDVQWTKKFPTDRPGFRNMVQSPDGTYFLSYCQFPFGNYYEAIRLDQNGNTLFDKRIPLAPGYKVTWQVSSLAKSDSGYYFGCSVYDSLAGTYLWNLVELSQSGTVVWTKNYNATSLLGALNGMELCSNGDALLLGSAYDFNSQAYLGVVMRTAPNGNLLWTTRWAYAGHDLYPVDAEPAGNDFVVSVQDLQQSAGMAAVDFVKIDGSGNLIWEMRYTSTGPNSSLLPHDLIASGNNEFTVVAQRSGPQLGSVLLKVDATGQFISSRFYPQYTIYSIDAANPWQYSLAGTRDSMNEHYVTILTTDGNGMGCSDTTAAFGLGPVQFTSTTGGLALNHSLVAIPGLLSPVNAGIVEFDRCTITDGDDELMGADIDVYPSPASAGVVVQSGCAVSTVTFYDMNGCIVKQVQCNALRSEIDVQDLANGMYLLQIQTSNGPVSRRIVIAHE
jgi:hypothetical protein